MDLGSVRDRFWVWFGVGLGSTRGRFGLDSRSIWDRFRVGLGSVRDTITIHNHDNNTSSNNKNEDALSFVNWQSNKTNSKIVLAIHGYNDYSNAFEKPAKYLSKFGIKTIAFDLTTFRKCL